MPDRLSNRELNRATLARQGLLERGDQRVEAVVHHLVGMQAQEPLDPYTALWSRLDGFVPTDLGDLLTDRTLVRIVTLRGTIHLHTAEDAAWIRPLAQPVLDDEMRRHRELKHHLVGVDLAPVVAFAEPLLAARPLSGRQLRAALAQQFPDLDPAALALGCRNRIPLVQIPPRGVWGQRLQVTLTPLEAWTGVEVGGEPDPGDVLRRYLAAFGPASPTDIVTWSRLPARRAVFDDLRGDLRVFVNEAGKEVFDLPDAPRPDPDTPAPVRYLPEYDNLLLSHADRTRFIPADQPGFVQTNRPFKGTVLADGEVAATWSVALGAAPDGGPALVVGARRDLTKRTLAAIEAEGRRYLRFRQDGARTGEVQLLSDPT